MAINWEINYKNCRNHCSFWSECTHTLWFQFGFFLEQKPKVKVYYFRMIIIAQTIRFRFASFLITGALPVYVG